MEEICSSETPVITSPTWRHVPEDYILCSRRRENLKSYKFILRAESSIYGDKSQIIFYWEVLGSKLAPGTIYSAVCLSFFPLPPIPG
jgi:hypothetical protein